MIDVSKKRVVVTGGDGFLGRYLIQELQKRGCEYIAVPHHRAAGSRSTFDLRNPSDVRKMYDIFRPDIVIHAAAHCGGILLNQEKPAELFYDNAIMGILLMDEAYKYGVEKYVQLGTCCSYPKHTPVPFREDNIWGGYPEETNAPYGIAKKALMVQGQAYRQQYGFNAIHLLVVNLYGPGDNLDRKIF